MLGIYGTYFELHNLEDEDLSRESETVVYHRMFKW